MAEVILKNVTLNWPRVHDWFADTYNNTTTEKIQFQIFAPDQAAAKDISSKVKRNPKMATLKTASDEIEGFGININMKKFRSNGNLENLPKILDENGKPWDESRGSLGNGTVAHLKFWVSDKDAGTQTPIKIQAIRVVEPVVYVAEPKEKSPDDELFEVGTSSSPKPQASQAADDFDDDIPF